MSNYTEPRHTQTCVELIYTYTHVRASPRVHACVLACVRACRAFAPMSASRWTGGSSGGGTRATCVRGGGDSLQQFYNCPTGYIVPRSLNEIRETPLRFHRREFAPILTPAIHSSASLDYRLPATGPPFLSSLVFIFFSESLWDIQVIYCINYYLSEEKKANANNLQ